MNVVRSMKNRTTTRIYAGGFAMAIAISGCAVAPPPIAHTPNVVATPEQGRVAISVAAAPTVGEVTPVYVSVANGTNDTRSVVPSQVFALNDAGERVAPLPPPPSGLSSFGPPAPVAATGSDARLLTSCRSVVHIGDSTSDGLVLPAYQPDPELRIAAQYRRVGVTAVHPGGLRGAVDRGDLARLP